MSSGITLTAGVRANLLALQQTTNQENTTQEALATGKSVNSALDNPTNYFTASALSARSSELTGLLDSMTNGVNTINAANNGLTSITTTIQSLEATVTQARQDASWQTGTYSLSTSISTGTLASIGFSGGAVGSTTVNVNLNDQETVTAGAYTQAGSAGSAGTLVIQASDINSGNAITVTVGTADTVSTVAANINSAAGYALATVSSSDLKLVDAANNTITVTANNSTTATNVGFVGSSVTSSAAAGATETVDEIVAAINGNASLSGVVSAANNAGQLQITNLSTSALTVHGLNTSGSTVAGGSGTGTIAGNSVRANLVTQFNTLRNQLDQTADDSSFNGINLLTGDQLKLFFNETSTSSLTIQSTNSSGVNSASLGIGSATDTEFQDNASLDSRLQSLQTALTTVASQASAFGDNLSIVQNRQDFTNSMINTLTTGADGLTLADGNLEGANMLALQTRQQLSITALSLASQAQQAVLRLFS
jgi:flagellin